MPAARAIWKGHIRLSLVSIPVELYAATESKAKVSFRQIHEPTGKPIHYEKVVTGVGPVDKDEIMRGFEYEKGNYVLLDDEDLDAVKLETKRTLDLTQFVDSSEIAPIYYDTPYFVVPQDELAEDAFRVVRDALRDAGKVGIGQLALRGKEYLCAVRPCGTGILLETLHYEEEIRKSDAYFNQISGKTADDDLLAVAKELINRKTAPFDAAAFKDHYTAALRQLINEKLKAKGGRVTDTEEPAGKGAGGGNVIDLMAALKQSLEASGGNAGKPVDEKPKATKPKTRTAKKAEPEPANQNKPDPKPAPKAKTRKTA
ncbi:DNA end-binding protein Ku [Faunimonas pinastri]|uniref:Non-homologous end joining protein Ku n=1 Tax=Faunimonas pinastri TaxID=1855383 RepID=A0A1H9NSI7_9HYPH|nr:Ku protein [Faunimonas pinastri]SER38930.1 DNA end-binding protein Ku [Faunimonas pinastri]